MIKVIMVFQSTKLLFNCLYAAYSTLLKPVTYSICNLSTVSIKSQV